MPSLRRTPSKAQPQPKLMATTRCDARSCRPYRFLVVAPLRRAFSSAERKCVMAHGGHVQVLLIVTQPLHCPLFTPSPFSCFSFLRPCLCFSRLLTLPCSTYPVSRFFKYHFSCLFAIFLPSIYFSLLADYSFSITFSLCSPNSILLSMGADSNGVVHNT